MRAYGEEIYRANGMPVTARRVRGREGVSEPESHRLRSGLLCAGGSFESKPAMALTQPRALWP